MRPVGSPGPRGTDDVKIDGEDTGRVDAARNNFLRKEAGVVGLLVTQ